MAMVILGLVVALLWRYLGLHSVVYEGVPAMMVGFATYAISLGLRSNSSPVQK
jgi:hypothetical protein